MQKISIVIPVWNEQETVPLFLKTMNEIHENQLKDMAFEYWFIDDGSTDDTLRVLQEEQEKNPDEVHYVSFSRNFGKEAGLYAGLENATGDYVAVMDVDLQDPPELLPEMLAGVQSGEWDAVGTRRVTRAGEPPIRTFFSKLFYKLINKISDTHIVEGARDYRVMSRQMVNALLSMTEYNRFSKGMFSWVGFRQKYLEFENRDRVAGTTSWSFWSLFKYSIEGIVAFSQVPLAFVSVLGLLSFFAAFIGVILIVIRALAVAGSSVAGWPSLVVIVLFMGGVQLLSLGIVGRYISSIYLEVKHRPIYISREKK
ncbi:glycosyltransferase family 2 protein [Weissella confusa]|uniref:glycosyltransferase family 2 protein n=1 Tax=Weissella confusa TaxID=1583 RepID=UPI0010806CE9|nr:glycosyltransferase family 2 protein [Weissella confusa]MBJ7617633.1 glycosyltransferase family 2 protein [Weissella confusa]MBJ7651269.1 glycosyltransferase family 2 protein [Weissella confusa]MBJ7657629.1 glycosyltransferase family 2 protein [Weissella confusa]MBJ7665579.1 glycosyltransferase family 2 protein [Weissella confusa]MCT0009968.1 glycosyltransferase [Weissella confusa]